MNRTRVSMSQLAQRAGVHVSTVSRALHGQKSIPKETRQRIQNLAARLGYRPDPLLNALCAYRKNFKGVKHAPTFAIIATSPTWKENLAHRLYCEGARERAHAQGYHTEIFVMTPSHLRGRRLAGILTTRGIRGVIVLPLADVSIPLEFPWEKFLVVATGYELQAPNISRISTNHFSALRDALLQIHSLGYRRPGLVLRAEGPHLAPDGMTYVNKLWQGSYLAESARLFPDLRIPAIQLTDRPALARWLLRYKPDVVISQHRELLGFLPTTHTSMPIVYTMVDDDEKLTGIHQNSRHVGRHAVNLLMAGLYQEDQNEQTVPVAVLIETRWQAGTTATGQRLALATGA